MKSLLLPLNNGKNECLKTCLKKYITFLTTLYTKRLDGNQGQKGVFATSTYYAATQYGYDNIFFPADGYKFAWNPDVEDLYSWYQDSFSFEHTKYIKDPSYKNMERVFKVSSVSIGRDVNERTVNQFIEAVKEEIDETIRSVVNGYKTSNLDDAIDKGKEISFKCDHYYLVPANMERYVRKMIKEADL